MKKCISFFTALLLLAVTACTGKQNTSAGNESDSTQTESQNPETIVADDGKPKPVFAFCDGQSTLQVIYWTGIDRPDESCDEEVKIEWAKQDLLRHKSGDYTQIVEGNNVYDVVYERDIEPAEDDFLGAVRTNNERMPGLVYQFANPSVTAEELGYCFPLLLPKGYLNNTHRSLLSVKNYDWEGVCDDLPLSSVVVARLEKRYDMKATRSHTAAIIDDHYEFGLVQFAPKNKKALALLVLVDGETIATCEQEGDYFEEDDECCWNVDDGGFFLPTNVVCAIRTDGDLTIYTRHYASESSTLGWLEVKENKLVEHTFASYYMMYD